MVIGQFQGRDASQRPPHDPEVRSKISSGKLGSDLFEDSMGVLSKVGKGRDPAADTITSVIGDDQVQVCLMVEKRDLIIIAHHFAISVKEKDPWSLGVARVETARDENTFTNLYREVKGILRTRRNVLPRIENVL
jgi:hypothetical protein